TTGCLNSQKQHCPDSNRKNPLQLSKKLDLISMASRANRTWHTLAGCYASFSDKDAEEMHSWYIDFPIIRKAPKLTSGAFIWLGRDFLLLKISCIFRLNIDWLPSPQI